jgi:hypothetical protein
MKAIPQSKKPIDTRSAATKERAETKSNAIKFLQNHAGDVNLQW